MDNGTRVYYTGDMANQSANCEVVGQRAGQIHLREIDGTREFFVFPSHIGHEYHGHCNPGSSRTPRAAPST
jgi:hypothetical protein